MPETLEVKTDEAWSKALSRWNHPSIPSVISVETKEDMQGLGEIGQVLQGQLAFMKYPEFQTYINVEKITEEFKENPQRGLQAIANHEVGHRFCPYDVVTSVILAHAVKKALRGQKLPYDVDSATGNILNLFTDMCINTKLTRAGEQDISWAQQQLSRTRSDAPLWRVYAKSNELAWKRDVLPKNVKLSDEESQAAKELSDLFRGDFFDKRKWPENIGTYARIISRFLKDEEKDKKSSMDNTGSGNLPKKMEEKLAGEVAKRLVEIGSDGMPTNSEGLKEFQEMMAGFGQGNPLQASIMFYDLLSNSYNVMFATKPFGRSRLNPFQPIKWTPSMDASKLDVDYSVQTGGRIIPGVNTYGWNTRKREAHGGFEEVVPDLDIYLDTSQSMPNPIQQMSLPVLAGFVAAKKAHKKGANIRATNFSGEGQALTQDSTRDLQKIYQNLTKHFNGGTVFPVRRLLQTSGPKQAIIITDAELGNERQTADAIAELRERNKANRVTVYALNPVDDADYLRKAGAEVIQGTTTDIFKRVIGKADEVYER